MKRAFNITLEEKTIQELRESANELEISASAFITMLYKNYQREETALKLLKNKQLMDILEELQKEMKRI